MPTALRFRPLIFALAIALGGASGRALQLGESKAQIVARHGAPAVEDHARQLAMYYWDGWSAQLEFQNGSVAKLTYRRNTYIEDAEIQSLLQANGGLKNWTEITPPGATTRLWARADGGQASCDRTRATSITFQTGGVANADVTPAEAIVADSFLKFAAPSEAIPNAAPESPRSEIAAPMPALRTQAELRADDVESAPAANPPESITPKPMRGEIASAPARTTTAQSARGSAIFGALVALGALIAGATCFFKMRRAPAATATPLPVESAAPVEAPAPCASASAALELLDLDQSELLVGEIFRRAGFTIELSAALGADGRVDLMLRRDGECIPVQCKHWKSACVTAQEVREFYSAMADTGAPRGILVTTGTFASDAREFAAENSIELFDRRALEQRIAGAQRPGENFCDVSQWVGDFTAHARIFDPECPCCGGTMVIRHHRTDGTPSWACATYPRCAGKRDPRRDLLNLHAAA